MSAPVPPFSDWPRKKLERHAAMLRKDVMRYRATLEAIAALKLECYAVGLARTARQEEREAYAAIFAR